MTLGGLSGTSADRYNDSGFTVFGCNLLCTDHFGRRDRWYVNMKMIKHTWIDPYDNIWVTWHELGAQSPYGWETSKRPDWIPSGLVIAPDGAEPQIPDYVFPNYYGAAYIPNDVFRTDDQNEILDSGDPGPPVTTVQVIQVNNQDPLKPNDLGGQGHITHYENEIHWPPTDNREDGAGTGGSPGLEQPARFSWIRAGNTRPPGVPGHDSYEMDFQSVRAQVQRGPSTMSVIVALQHLVRLITCCDCNTSVSPVA